jgi:hypothetical protein
MGSWDRVLNSVFLSSLWGAGMPVRPLPSGVILALRFPNGTVAKVDVIGVTATEAIIQTSNRAKWRMVQTEPKALHGPLPGTADAPTTYWTVKDQVIEQGARRAR